MSIIPLYNIINYQSISSFIMSIDFQRVALIYEQSSLIIESKSILVEHLSLSKQNDSSSNNNPKETPKKMQAIERFNMVTEPISDLLIRVITIWQQKIEQLQKYNSVYMRCSRNLQEKAKSLRNNTSLLTKEEQLLSEIQSIMQKYNRNTDPLQYFDIAYRLETKTTIERKLAEIEQAAIQTKQSATPMYTHKIEKQLKYSIYDAHQQQSNNDQNFRQLAIKIYADIKEKISTSAQAISSSRIMENHSYLENQMHQFFQENSDIIEKIGKQHKRYKQIDFLKKAYPEQNRLPEKYFNKYYVSLTNKTKQIQSYWYQLQYKLDKFIRKITELIDEISLSQEQFRKGEEQIYKNLENISNDIGRMFQVEVIFNFMKKFHENFSLVKILNEYKKKLFGLGKHIMKMENSVRQYATKLTKQIELRSKNMKNYLLEDKSFLQEHSKAEQYIIYHFIQNTKEILHSMYSIVKNINKMTDSERRFYTYQEHQINKILKKLIIQEQLSPNEALRESLKSSGQGTTRSRIAPKSISHKRLQKNQKKKAIQKFLDEILIFNKDFTKNLRQYQVALGPRFLLHGKMIISEKGIYYQSFFNKKTVFFGKTKMFIEKEEILEIDEKNTLLIFPDAIEIKTSKGPIYFHALGSRKAIYRALNDQYFPENNRDDVSYISEGDFQEAEIQSFPKIQNQEKLFQPLETIITEKVFNGCKVNKFFRRYFSDDKFEIRGKFYENFKSYFLETIDAIDPKSTPLTPEPPAYFMYRNESSPEIQSEFSQRLHTYRKAIPKIPFISKGGDGFCQQRQIYHWISPQCIVIDSVSVVKGFSITEGMQVLTKNIIKQQGTNIKLIISGTVEFSTQSSTNNLLKTPALSNLKTATAKMCQIIEKYEKGKKSKGSSSKQQVEDDPSNEKIETLVKQNQKLKKQLKYMGILFVIVYLVSLVMMQTVHSL